MKYLINSVFLENGVMDLLNRLVFSMDLKYTHCNTRHCGNDEDAATIGR